MAYVADNPRADQAPIAVEMPYGDGRIVAIGFDLGSQYPEGAQYLHRTMMREIADRLYVPMVKLESAYGLLEIVCLEKDGRRMIQLVNGNGSHGNPQCATDDQIPPVLDIELSIELPEAPAKLMLRPEGRELSFVYRDGRAYVTVERVNIHSVIEVLNENE